MNTGETIGPYVIQSPLGSGGMGKVYRARDTRLGRDVALKQLSDPSLAGDVARGRVLQEARAAAGLSHPNIATIFDVLDTPDGPTLVMEYVPGESLAHHVARGALPAARALEIAGQICDGLIEAHARGIVHRDLKPANIQITPDGKAKILDFGIAQLTVSGEEQASAPTVTSSVEAGRLSGSPGYMAPEQLGGGRADERTDIYAVGVVLYEMLTGRRPYPGGDLLSSALAVLKGGAPPVSELVPGTPPLVSALVERAMAREAADRFPNAGELARELRRARDVLSGATTSPLPRASPRRGALTLALAAIAAVMLAVAGWQWVRDSGEPVVSAHGSVFAVLPFTNGTEDPANDPVAVGLTDAVANRLSSLESVRVLPLDQSRDAAGSAADGAAAARALGARFVVEGALRRSGQTLDVEVALVSGDGQRRHAGRYTGDIAQAFDLHGRIAQGVIAALAASRAVAAPVPPSPPATLNQQAYAEYSQARLFLERPDVPGNLDHAIRLFLGAIAKDERFALAHAGLGQAYWSQYQQTNDPAWTSKATAAIVDALRIDQKQPGVQLSLAVMYQGLGRIDDAEKELRGVLAVQPWNDDAYRLLAGVHIERGQWDRAVEELRRAIELRPNYWRNHSELGFAHLAAGRLDESAKAYTRVVELQPDSALGYHMLGTVHQTAGRLPEALANYERAGAIRPRHSTYSNIGTIHFWTGQYARAEAAYRKAIEQAPNAPGLHANLGDTLQKLGRRQAARDSYRSAVDKISAQLAVNDKDAVNLALLAVYQAKLTDRAAADASLAKALAVNAGNGEVLYAAAMVDALAGRAAAACDRLGKALALGTSREVVRRADEFRLLKGCDAYDTIVTQR